MILCGFRDVFPAQENGHYTIPEKKNYSQMLRVLYQATKMSPVILDIGFLDADLDNNREKTKWCALLEPQTTVQDFMYGVAAMLQNLEDKEIPQVYSSLVFAIKPNRPELISSIELFNRSYIWGIQNDANEDDMVAQVKEKLKLTGEDESLKRKIYRQRVTNIQFWDDINQEKFVSLPVNQIPQKGAKMDQLFQNSINDAWNEPSIIKVIIVQQDFNPNKFDFIHDSFELASAIVSQKVTINETLTHPDQQHFWQFGIDRLKVQEFIQSWLSLERLVFHTEIKD